MKIILSLFVPLLITVVLLLTACGGGTTPSLAVANQPTLVLIYADG
jgi:hypothetical protein